MSAELILKTKVLTTNDLRATFITDKISRQLSKYCGKLIIPHGIKSLKYLNSKAVLFSPASVVVVT